MLSIVFDEERSNDVILVLAEFFRIGRHFRGVATIREFDDILVRTNQSRPSHFPPKTILETDVIRITNQKQVCHPR